MTLEATLFDMDGLLIDSEILWHKAEVEIFGRLGVPMSASDGRSTKGLFVDEVVDYWYALYPWSGTSLSDVSEELLTRVGDLVEAEGRLMPGALRAIDLAGERGPIALASSTPVALIARCLNHFDLADRFASIHSAQFEPYGKPHPASFSRPPHHSGFARLNVWCSRIRRPACSPPKPPTCSWSRCPHQGTAMIRSSRSLMSSFTRWKNFRRSGWTLSLPRAVS